jgi:CBS domain-containing protein
MTSTIVARIADQARSRLVTVGLDALLLEVAQRLAGPRIHIVVVCDADGSMAGVISKTDIVRRIGHCQGSACTTLAVDFMTRSVRHCGSDQPLGEVLTMMHTLGLEHVPVVDEAFKPVGVVDARDALRALLADEQYEEALLRDYVMGVGYH